MKLNTISVLTTAAFVCLAVLLGCSRPSMPHRHIIILIDVSASIEKDAEEEAFQAITHLVAGTARGDSVTIIPITGDADADIQGRILRFRAPTRREAYDQDRKRFSQQVRQRLESAQAAAIGDPGSKTDILGTIQIAAEELALDPPGTDQQIIILSDFIQDSESVKFTNDPMLGSRRCANELARALAKDSKMPNHLRVFLGALRSTDLSRLDRERRAAIREFWNDYFDVLGDSVLYSPDGPGATEAAVLRVK